MGISSDLRLPRISARLAMAVLLRRERSGLIIRTQHSRPGLGIIVVISKRRFHPSNCLSTSAGAVEPYDWNALMAFSTPSTPRDLGAELGMGLGEFGVGEVGQAFEPSALAQADQAADHLVRRALGDAARIRYSISVVASRKPSSSRSAIRSARRAAPSHHDRRQLQAGFDRVEGVEQRLLVLLQVAVVGQGQAP